MAGNVRSGARRKLFLRELLTGATIAMAAKSAGISERTAYRYLSEPAFKRELESAVQDVWQCGVRRLRNGFNLAIDSLTELAVNHEAPPSVRVSAASKLLDAQIRIVELMNVEQRLCELEEQLLDTRERNVRWA